MNIPAIELQKALQEFQEWGEKLRTPYEIRIAKLLPHRSEKEISDIIEVCKKVESTAWEIATSVRDEGLEKEAAIKIIKERFPFMNSANITRTFGQAMYYTLK